MNKYQKALDYIKSIEVCPEENIYVCDFEEVNVLQELVDQTKQPTLEEIKKEWEEDDWVWIINEEKVLHLWKKDIYNCTNHITCDLKYKELEFNFSKISIEILERLAKTLKALGWE